MKILFILFFTISFLQSGEIQRIESIVQDIVKLRGDYEECKKSLGNNRNFRADRFEKRTQELELLLDKEKLKTKKLTVLLNKKCTSTNLNNEAIDNLEKILDSKNNEIKSLKNEIKKMKIKPKMHKKKVHKEKVVKKVKKISKSIYKGKIEIIKPTTFCLKNDSIIYDTINGQKIAYWEKNTTFTSNQKTKSYIKITGYFISMKWKKAKKEMWIKINDVYSK